MADKPNPSDYDALDATLDKHTGVMPVEMAFITILAGAVFADNKVRNVETQELDALIARAKTLRGKTDAERKQMRDAAFKLVKEKTNRRDQVKIAAESILRAQNGIAPALPIDGLAESVFAHACDIACTDLKIPKEEVQFLSQLALDLKMDKERAKHIMKTIGLKNAF